MIQFKQYIEESVDESWAKSLATAATAATILASNPSLAKNKITDAQPAQVQKSAATNAVPKVSQYRNLLTELITHHEGVRNKVYKDSKGIPTIGIGFNLNSIQAAKTLKSMGISYSNVLAGKRNLTDKEISYLFNISLDQAISDAAKFFPDIDHLPPPAQIILVDMAFNLGYTRLAKFKNFKAALEERNYRLAANEMVDSRWYYQVGNRSKRLVGIMRSLAKSNDHDVVSNK